jgi:hypothetical protein
VSYSDPFGLDVEIGDSATRADIADMRGRSKTFDNAMRALEDNHRILVTIGRGSTAGCGGSGGCVEPPTTNQVGQTVYNVIISNDGGIESDNAVLKNAGGANALTVMAHEVYGHVHHQVQTGRVCHDGPPGTPASRSCSVRRENVIRRDLSIPIRKWY